MSKDSTAQVIRDTLGGSDRCSWYGDITDALFCGLDGLAKSIQGSTENGCNKREASLCQSLDGIAGAINNLADAVKQTKEVA